MQLKSKPLPNYPSKPKNVDVQGRAGIMRNLQARGQQQEKRRKVQERRRCVLARLEVPNNIRINHTRSYTPGGDWMDRDSRARLG